MKRIILFIMFIQVVSFLGYSQTSHLVISQVYGGGGNTGATYLNDYIEIFNPTSAAISLAGFSVQYAAATGTTWLVTPLSGSVPAGGYYLIKEASGGAVGVSLPAPDATGTINMSATVGKIALVSSTTAQTVACPTGALIIDFVGYGTTASCFEGSGKAPAISNILANFRADYGCTDSNDNSADFSTATPNPRNSATAIHLCSSAPSLSVSALTSFGSQCTGGTYGPNSFTITGTILTTANVAVAALLGYTYSTTAGGTYTSSLSLVQAGGAFSQTIYVKFSPTLVQSYNGNIVVSGGGAASSVSCTATGSGVNSSSITLQPSNQSVSEGGNISFTISATAAASFKWQISTNGGGTWSDITAAGSNPTYSNWTTATLSLAGVVAGNNGYQYRCVVTSSCGGTVTSNAATLTVLSGPVWLIDEDFDATTGPANLGTSTTGPFTSSGTWFTASATVANRGTNALFMSDNGTLTTPFFANGDLLCFWMGHAVGNVSAGMQVEVTTDGSNWTVLDDITLIPAQARFYYYPIATNIIQVRFNYNDGNNNDIYFDDVMVRSADMCTTTPLIEKVHVNSCAAVEEGVNEFVLVDVDQAINVSDMVITFPSADPGTLSFCSDCDKTFVPNPTYTDAINDLAGCMIAFEPSGGVIPANSKLVIFTGSTPEFTYDLGGACGSGVIYYVIYCNNTNISGRFANDPGTTNFKQRHVSIIDMGSGCYDQVYYDDAIPVSDGEFAYYDLITRVVTYGNNGCTEALLPIELLYFKSTCSEDKVKLYWATMTETNNAYFTIESSDDAAADFVSVAKVQCAGNSNEFIEYSFDVENNAKYYRLKQTDFDGNFSYSDIEAVECDESEVQVYPTISSVGTPIKIIGDVQRIDILDNMGKVIHPKMSENQIFGLAPGMYFLVINSRWTFKVVVS